MIYFLHGRWWALTLFSVLVRCHAQNKYMIKQADHAAAVEEINMRGYQHPHHLNSPNIGSWAGGRIGASEYMRSSTSTSLPACQLWKHGLSFISNSLVNGTNRLPIKMLRKSSNVCPSQSATFFGKNTRSHDKSRQKLSLLKSFERTSSSILCNVLTLILDRCGYDLNRVDCAMNKEGKRIVVMQTR